MKTAVALVFTLVVAMGGWSGSGWAAEPVSAAQNGERPAWLDEEVVGAAIRIGMDESQQVQFRESVTLFLQSFGQEVEKLVRRGVPNLENQVRRKRKSLTREMDERMAGFLSAEQMPRYETYRDLLLSRLKR
ncbi:MAG: hypothetical protein R3E82_01825 [Pseudomonadales bacterium]